MTRGIFGRTQAEVDRKLDGASRDELAAAVIAGTVDEFVDRLGRLSDAGVQRVMLQCLETDDVDGLEAMAGPSCRSFEVCPAGWRAVRRGRIISPWDRARGWSGSTT